MFFRKRLAILAAASSMALLLASCGGGAISADSEGSDTTGAGSSSDSDSTGSDSASAPEPESSDSSGSDDSDSGSDDDVITIGLLTAETGTYSSLGEAMKNAADLFLEEHHNKIAGVKVKLVVGDSAGDPETAKSKAKELVLRDKVDVIAGVVASPVAVTVADVAEENEVPFVISNAGANDLTGDDASPYVWRTSQSNFQHGYAAGVYAAEQVSKTNGVFMGADYSAGTQTRDGFIAGYKDNGGEDLLDEILTPFGSTQNYQPFLSQIPDDAAFVYAFYAGGEAITFEKNYAEFGYNDKFPLLGAQNLTDEDVLPALGDAGEGVITIGMYAPALDNDANKAYTKEWQDKYDVKPSIISVTTYDAFNFIAQAAENVDGPITSQSLTDAFASVGDLDSPRGTFTIDPDTHNPVQDYYVRKLEKDGDGFTNTVIETIPSVS